MKRFIIGLTGGIGSGKSLVADRFAALGVCVVDTDLIAHELTRPEGKAMGAIGAAFGGRMLESDGRLNRALMRRLVFSDASAKRRLEAILHPMIRRESKKRCQQADSPYVILVVPLLAETPSYRRELGRVLLVDCDELTQEGRVMARNAFSSGQVRAIMATQASRQARQSIADDIILNDGDIEALVPRVMALHRQYLALARCFNQP